MIDDAYQMIDDAAPPPQPAVFDQPWSQDALASRITQRISHIHPAGLKAGVKAVLSFARGVLTTYIRHDRLADRSFPSVNTSAAVQCSHCININIKFLSSSLIDPVLNS